MKLRGELGSSIFHIAWESDRDQAYLILPISGHAVTELKMIQDECNAARMSPELVSSELGTTHRELMAQLAGYVETLPELEGSTWPEILEHALSRVQKDEKGG